MLYGTSIMVSYVGTFLKKNRIFAVIAMAILAYISIYSNPQINNDYPVYETAYQAGSYSGEFEWFYTKLAQLAFAHGMPYLNFRFWLIAVASILFVVGLIRLTTNPNFVIVGYALTAYFVDTVQVRNYVMLAMLLFAYSFLVKEKVLDRLVALFFGVLASGIHSLGFIFLIGMVLSLLPLKSLIRLVYLVVIAAAFLQVLYFITGPMIVVNLIAKVGEVFIGRADFVTKVTTLYISGMSLNTIRIVFVSWLYFGTGLILILRGFIPNMESYITLPVNHNLETKLKIILSVLVVGIAGLSLMNVSLDYSRIVRVSFVFELIGISMLKFPNERESNVILRTFAVIFVVIVAFYAQNIVYGQDFISKIPQLVTQTL